jgi:hypothetical protein
MTRQPPEQFMDALHRILADSGVALTICPHLKGTGIHGATFWMGSGKPYKNILHADTLVFAFRI